MNRGLIAGRVDTPPALVYVRGIYQLSKPFEEVYNLSGGWTLHGVETDVLGRFFVPFEWEGTDLGDALANTMSFRVFAVHTSSSAKGEAIGQLAIGPDWAGLFSKIAKAAVFAGLLKLNHFELAEAVKDAFGTVKPSPEYFCMLGLVVIKMS